MANEFKRMQKLAGIITENQYRESINEEEISSDLKSFLLGMMDTFSEGNDNDYPAGEHMEFKYEEEMGDEDLYDEKTAMLFNKAKMFLSKNGPITLQDKYAGVPLDLTFSTDGEDIKMEWIEPSLDEAKKLNENKPYALLATVADDWGKDSDLYGDLEAAVIGWTDRNGELSPKGKIAIKNLLSNWDILDDYEYFIDGIPSDDDSAPSDKMNEGDTDYDRAEDAKRLGKKGEKNIYGAGVEKGEEIEKKKMKMSELKAAIKELALSEGEDDVNFNDDESLYDPVAESVWSVLPDRIPEFIQKIKDIKDEYHAVVGSDDVYDGLDHAISAAEELMNSKLNEAKKDEEVVDDSETIDTPKGDEEITADVTTTDVDPDVKAVQDALTQAQAAAEKLGDDKLTDQIGNTITFFTRSHIVDKPGMTAESNIKERISKLVKSL
jgi:hypothetical protein